MSIDIAKFFLLSYIFLMDQFISMISGFSLALVCYDVIGRLKHKKEMTDTLAKLNKAHNDLTQSFQALSEQVSHMEMQVGLKAKNR